MDDRAYSDLVEQALARVEESLEGLDPDQVEVDRGGGHLTLTFGDGSVCVVSTQRAVRQLWVAADHDAWRFSRDEKTQTWRAQGSGEELHHMLEDLVARKRRGAGER
jgi:iron donor protein CyaY